MFLQIYDVLNIICCYYVAYLLRIPKKQHKCWSHNFMLPVPCSERDASPTKSSLSQRTYAHFFFTTFILPHKLSIFTPKNNFLKIQKYQKFECTFVIYSSILDFNLHLWENYINILWQEALNQKLDLFCNYVSAICLHKILTIILEYAFQVHVRIAAQYYQMCISLVDTLISTFVYHKLYELPHCNILLGFPLDHQGDYIIIGK